MECYIAIHTSKVIDIDTKGDQNIIDRKTSQGLAECFAELWKTGLLHDFTITCRDQSFRCHKNILATRLTYFASMFNTTNVPIQENIKNSLDIKDCDPKTVKNFIEYIYNDDLDDDSGFANTELLILSERFNFDQLKLKCELAISKTLDLSNAVKLLSIASIYSARTLLKSCAGFIGKNKGVLIDSEDWNQMVKTNPQALEDLYRESLPWPE